MKKFCMTALFWFSCLAALAPAQALQITLSPHGGNQIAPGGILLVDLGIAGLQSGSLSTELGAWQLDLYYDPDLLMFIPGAPTGFGTALGRTVGVTEALTGADHSTPGLLRLDEVSLLDGLTLDGLQGDGFRLATVAFQVLTPMLTAPANTILFADDVLLGDAGGNRIPVALSEIPVLILQVDEPATLAIFGLGLAALVWSRRRQALR